MNSYSIQEFASLWNEFHQDKSIILDKHNRRVQFVIHNNESLTVHWLSTGERLKFIVDELFTIFVCKNLIEIGSAEYNHVFKIL